MLKEYYATYLRNVRNLTERSVKHYMEALRWISRFLREKEILQKDIYEVADLPRLEKLREMLFADKDFCDLNSRGHQMYSAGMNNYLKFAEAEDFAEIGQKITYLDIPVGPRNVVLTQQDTWQRSAIVRNQVLMTARFQCEINPQHKTYTVSDGTHQYAEGHHIIPINQQGAIPFSLDVYANIVCLCPNCHRFLHHGIKQEKKVVIDQLYEQRADRMANSGIKLSKTEYEEMA